MRILTDVVNHPDGPRGPEYQYAELRLSDPVHIDQRHQAVVLTDADDRRFVLRGTPAQLSRLAVGIARCLATEPPAHRAVAVAGELMDLAIAQDRAAVDSDGCDEAAVGERLARLMH